MKLRKLLSEDFQIIDWIWKKYHQLKFGIPSLKNVIADRVVIKGSQVVAYGMVKAYCEAIMVLDLSLSTRDRVEALKLLMADAEQSAKLAGIEQLQIFVQDDNFRDILIKHFGYAICAGTPLVKTISD